MDYRNLKEEEKRLLILLIKRAGLKMTTTEMDKLLVREMDDGGMGSLYISSTETVPENRIFGRQASEYFFDDLDGVKVIASLYLDKEGRLFEIDMWKTDFSPLKKW